MTSYDKLLNKTLLHSHNGRDVRGGHIGSVVPVDTVSFNTSFTDGHQEGRLQWNTEDGTLEYGLAGNNVNLQIGQETVVKVSNGEATPILNGTVVSFVGSQGNRPKAYRCIAGDPIYGHPCGVATEDIISNGYVTTNGLVRDIDTSGLSVGVVYANGTGGLTSTRPTAPNEPYCVGMCLVSNNNGLLYVNPQNIKLYTETDSRYLKLDASNDPLTGNLTINTNSTTALVVEQTGVNSNTLVVDTNTGSVGIGYTSPPIGVLIVGGTTTHSVGAYISPTVTNGTTGTTGVRLAPVMSPTASIATVVGSQFLGSLSTTFNITNYQTFQIRTQTASASSGTINNSRGLYVNKLFNGAIPTTIHGIFIDNHGQAGATDTNALFIQSQTGSTNNYAIKTGTGQISFGDKMTITGSQDAVQAVIKANATQTTNLTEWQNSSGTVLASISGLGKISNAYISTQPTAQDDGAYLNTDLYVTGSMGQNVNALRTLAQFRGGGNILGALAGIRGTAFNSAANSIANVFGMTYKVGVFNASATITNLYGIEVGMNNGTAGTIGTYKGITLSAPIGAGSPTITSIYGLYIDSISQATTNNYAIVTNAGSVVFNEGGDASTDFRVESDTETDMLLVDANADTDGAIYLGGSTNGIKINKGGEMTFIGTATRWDDLRVEPIVRNASSKSPSFTNVFGSIYCYYFDNAILASEKEVHFQVQMPHGWKEGSTIEPHIHWIPTTAGTAGEVVKWGLEYSKAKIGSAFSSTTTTIYGSTIVGGGAITTQYDHLLTPTTTIDMTGDTLSTVLLCRLFRNSSDAADTYTGTAGLLYIDFHYEIDTIGSKTDLAK